MKHDERLLENNALIVRGAISDIYFKNEAAYPWFILLPRVPEVTEWMMLDEPTQQGVMREIQQVSEGLHTQFQPDKINIATIGNQVPQLHIHVVGRFTGDPLWPASIWQPAYEPCAYSEADWQAQVAALRAYFEG